MARSVPQSHMPIASGDIPWSRLTALVLGGTGAIGRHVVEACLRRSLRVRVLLRSSSSGRNLAGVPVERVEGDLEEPATIGRALEGCDILFHCAAPYPRSHFHRRRQTAHALALTEDLLEEARRCVPAEILEPQRSRLRVREVEEAEGAAHAIGLDRAREPELRDGIRSPDLLERALDGRLDASFHPSLAASADFPGLKRIVYVSSITTIGRPRGARPGLPPSRPADEEDVADRPRGSSPYFAMKAGMEEAVVRAAVEGLPAVIVNPTFCVDTHDAGPTSGQLLLAVAAGRMAVYLPGAMNVVATRDVGEGIVRAAARGRTGMRYILGGENMAAREFLSLVARVAGVAPPRLPLPLPLAEGIAWLTEAANLALRRPWPLLPVSGVQMIRWSQAVDTRRARTELDLPHTPIETAVGDALRWYRENGYL